MRIVCAPDSFKESMSAVAACKAMYRGIRSVWPEADIVEIPMADGGEGSASAIATALEGRLISVPTTNANGQSTTGHIAFLPSENTAVIEIASACGLEDIPPHKRDPLTASSRGVADLVLAALDLNVSRIIFALGGSAVNDAGAGMLSGLGVRFLDREDVLLEAGGGPLLDLASIDASGLDSRLNCVQVIALSDVDSPLLGERGASRVFGPQKGADSGTVDLLERALTRWAEVVAQSTGSDHRDTPGAGAAGGFGAAVLSFMGADMRPGADHMMSMLGLEGAISSADLVFTGEGSLDLQSLSGKVPYTVARFAESRGKPVLSFVGRVDAELEKSPPDCFSAIIPIGRGVTDLKDALKDGATNLEHTTAMACKILELGRQTLA